MSTRRPMGVAASLAVAVTLTVALAGSARADWSTPIDVPIAAPATPEPLSLRVGVGTDGTATLVWSEFDDPEYDLRTTRIAPDGSVATIRDLLGGASQAARHVEVGIGPDGTATVVWQQDNGGEGVVQFARIDPSGIPEAVQDLSEDGEDATAPHMDLGPDGAATVVWRRAGGGDDATVGFVRIEPGETVGEVDEVSGDDGDAFTPRVAVGPDGTATVAWTALDSSDSDVGLDTVQIAADGDAGTVRPVVGDLDGSIYPPALAVGPDGAAMLVWQQGDESDDVVLQAARLDPDGEPGDVHDVGEPHYLAAASLSDGPSVVAGPDGSATAVWTRSDFDDPWTIQTARLAADGAPGPARDLSSGVLSALNPRAAIDPDGTVTAVWDGYDATLGDSAIEAVRIAPKGTIGPVRELALSKSPEGIPDVSSAAIASSSQGAVAAAWQSAAAVHAARFVVTVPPGPSGPVGPPSSRPPAGSSPPAPPTAAPRASFALRVRPRRRALDGRRRTRFTVTVRNNGARTATKVRICLRAPRRTFRTGRCLTIGRLGPGRQARRTLIARPTRATKRGRSYKLRVVVTSGAVSKSVTVRIKLR